MSGIVKTFPGVRALDGVDLEVRAGEVHCLLGQNGAGKSTLIKVLAGAHQPDSGEIIWQGEPSTLGSPVAALRIGQRDRLALPHHVPLVGTVRPGEDLDQGRLAGAVLAEQAVHLTGADVEVDAVERPDAREGLDDAVHLQQRGRHRSTSGLLLIVDH